MVSLSLPTVQVNGQSSCNIKPVPLLSISDQFTLQLHCNESGTWLLDNSTVPSELVDYMSPDNRTVNLIIGFAEDGSIITVSGHESNCCFNLTGKLIWCQFIIHLAVPLPLFLITIHVRF